MLLVVVLLSLSLVLDSCQKKCAECKNGATCTKKKTCICKGQWDGPFCDTLCPIGYEGDSCQILTKDQFIGNWDCSTTATDNSSSLHLIQVSNENYFVWVKFSNLIDQGFSMRGTITAKKRIEFYEQNAQGAYTGKADGSVTINGDEMTINIRKGGVDYFTKAKRL